MTDVGYAQLYCPMPDGEGGRCGAELLIEWTAMAAGLSVGDVVNPAAIGPGAAQVGSWRVSCTEEHTVLTPLPIPSDCGDSVAVHAQGGCDHDDVDELRTFRKSDAARLFQVLGVLTALPRGGEESKATVMVDLDGLKALAGRDRLTAVFGIEATHNGSYGVSPYAGVPTSELPEYNPADESAGGSEPCDGHCSGQWRDPDCSYHGRPHAGGSEPTEVHVHDVNGCIGGCCERRPRPVRACVTPGHIHVGTGAVSAEFGCVPRPARTCGHANGCGCTDPAPTTSETP